MFVLEILELAAIAVCIFVATYVWFQQYSTTYRTSKDRIGGLAATTFMYNPANNFDFSKRPVTNGVWDNVVPRGVIIEMPTDTAPGTAQVELKLPRLDRAEADKRYVTFKLIKSDRWTAEDPLDYNTLYI